MPDKPDATEKSEDFLRTALQRFDDSASDEKPIREQAMLDLRFVIGDQWEAAVKTQRIAAGRPALTFNRCHTFVQQVSNEARQNKPQIKFVSADSDPDNTAEIYEGLARHIQYGSEAQVAYETAVEYSAGGSFGYYRFLTEYCDDDSWDQELKVMPVLDPFAVYGVLIPSCFGMEPQYAFVVEEVPTEDYRREHQNSKIEDVGLDRAGQLSQGWVGTETVRVAEYWYVEQTKQELKRKHPTTGAEDTRTVWKKKVKFCKINGLEVVEGTETEWPGYCIPIIPVLGKQIILDGKVNLFSVVRFQRDPQQLINFYKTRIAETMGTSPIQPYVITEGQIKNHEREWAEMNTAMRPYLTYNQTDFQGKPAAPPQRQTFEPPIQSLSEAAAQEIDDMKATAGIFDASLGAKGNETSGKGIMARQQQSNVTNMHFMDNLERAFKKGGLVLEDVIPKIYDGARVIRILGPDETPKMVKINQTFTGEDGQAKTYKLGGEDAAKYHVIVTMGRAFSTKRMESFDMMSQILQGNPNLLPMIGDIFFKNSDVAGSEQLAERFQKMLPPHLQDDNKNALPPQAQAAIAQAQQQMAEMQQELQKLQLEKAGKVIDNEYKTDRELKLAQIQNDIKVLTALITAKAQRDDQEREMFTTFWKENHGAGHEIAMQKDQQSHERGMADTAHQQALEQGAQQGAISSAQSAQDAGQQSVLADQQAQQTPQA